MTMRLKLLACEQFNPSQDRAESIFVRKTIVVVEQLAMLSVLSIIGAHGVRLLNFRSLQARFSVREDLPKVIDPELKRISLVARIYQRIIKGSQ